MVTKIKKIDGSIQVFQDGEKMLPIPILDIGMIAIENHLPDGSVEEIIIELFQSGTIANRVRPVSNNNLIKLSKT